MTGVWEPSDHPCNSPIKPKSFFKVKKKKKKQGLLKNKTPVFLTIYLFHIKPMPLIGFSDHKVLLERWLKCQRKGIVTLQTCWRRP